MNIFHSCTRLFRNWRGLRLCLTIVCVSTVSIDVLGAGIVDQSSEHEDTVRHELREVDNLYRRGNPRGAIALAMELNNRYPDNAEVLFKLGVILIDFSGYSRDDSVRNTVTSREGLGYIKRSLELDDGNANSLAVYASVLTDFGEYKDAVLAYRKLFSDPPNRVDQKLRYLVISYATSLERLGRIQDGLEEIKKSLLATKYDEQISVGYVGVLAVAGDYKAILAFRDEYRAATERSVVLEYSVCDKVTALKEYKVALGCFRDMLGDETLSAGARKQVKQRIVIINEILEAQN